VIVFWSSPTGMPVDVVNTLFFMISSLCLQLRPNLGHYRHKI